MTKETNVGSEEYEGFYEDEYLLGEENDGGTDGSYNALAIIGVMRLYHYNRST